MIQIKRRFVVIFVVTFVVLMCCVFLNPSSQTHVKGFLESMGVTQPNQPVQEEWTSENIKVFLHSGDVNATSNKGTTPLKFSAEKGHLEIVQLLMKKKANLVALDIKGKTPLQVAEKNGEIDIIKLLKKPTQLPHKPSFMTHFSGLF